MIPEAFCVVDSGNQLGECPIWCPKEKVLWWIDVANPRLWKYSPSIGQVESWPLPRPPGAIALRKSGGLLIIFRRSFALLDAPGGELHPFSPKTLELGEQRFQDGKVDRAGRFWVGTMDRAQRAPIGQLYRLDANAAIATLDSGFVLSNGIGWSPDDTRMYFAETSSRNIYQYEFDVRTGSISARTLFAEVEAGPGGPDGLCVDGDGNVWSVLFDRGLINKYLPDGTLDLSLTLPIDRPTSCTFGGDDLKTLYITSARIGLTDGGKAMQPQAGGIWAVHVDRPGQPESYFEG